MIAGGMTFDRCPKAWARDDGAPYMDAVADVYTFMVHGVLPDGGGSLDQSPRWPETLDVVSSYQRALREAVKD